MNPELRQRIEKLKAPLLLKMRGVKGPCELVSWWERFVTSIPQGAGFEDLDRQQQELILSWEEDLSLKKSEKKTDAKSQ